MAITCFFLLLLLAILIYLGKFISFFKILLIDNFYVTLYISTFILVEGETVDGQSCYKRNKIRICNHFYTSPELITECLKRKKFWFFQPDDQMCFDKEVSKLQHTLVKHNVYKRSRVSII